MKIKGHEKFVLREGWLKKEFEEYPRIIICFPGMMVLISLVSEQIWLNQLGIGCKHLIYLMKI